jgi:hypothetical protein
MKKLVAAAIVTPLATSLPSSSTTASPKDDALQVLAK